MTFDVTTNTYQYTYEEYQKLRKAILIPFPDTFKSHLFGQHMIVLEEDRVLFHKILAQTSTKTYTTKILSAKRDVETVAILHDMLIKLYGVPVRYDRPTPTVPYAIREQDGHPVCAACRSDQLKKWHEPFFDERTKQRTEKDILPNTSCPKCGLIQTGDKHIPTCEDQSI